MNQRTPVDNSIIQSLPKHDPAAQPKDVQFDQVHDPHPFGNTCGCRCYGANGGCFIWFKAKGGVRMTAPMLASPLSEPIPSPLKKNRVLLVDASPSKRDLGAGITRKFGIEVDSAADISEARSWWRADLDNLVLIDVENGPGHRDKSCEDLRRVTPPQELAFLVGKPEYLAGAPNVEEASAGQSDSDPSFRKRRG